MGEWRPSKLYGDWCVEYATDERLQLPPRNRFFLGDDGTPLRFWGPKQAQIKADSLNRKGVEP
jgi:hypothetical protein